MKEIKSKRNKMWILPIILVSMVAIVVASMFLNERSRVMFTWIMGFEQYENFYRMAEIFPSEEMAVAKETYRFPENRTYELPASIKALDDPLAFGDDVPKPIAVALSETRSVDELLEATRTASLVVLKDGVLVYEDYWLTGGQDVEWISMSMAKSMTSIAIGLAVDDGLLDVQKTIADYMPEYIGSGYGNVKIIDILQMSSGIKWEEIGDSDKELFNILRKGGSLKDYTLSKEVDLEPGSKFFYKNVDTQVLTVLVDQVTGQSLASYLEEKLWQPMGMEYTGYWINDDDGVAFGYFGMNAVARDFAKVGEMIRLKGNWQGQQLLSEQWIDESVTTAQHTLSKNTPYLHDYGYQWWVPDSEDDTLMAVGIFGQYIYINRSKGVVIVKQSADTHYETDIVSGIQTLVLFEKIANDLNQ